MKTRGAVTKCQPTNHLKSTINRDAGAISRAIGKERSIIAITHLFGQNVPELQDVSQPPLLCS